MKTIMVASNNQLAGEHVRIIKVTYTNSNLSPLQEKGVKSKYSASSNKELRNLVPSHKIYRKAKTYTKQSGEENADVSRHHGFENRQRQEML